MPLSACTGRAKDKLDAASPTPPPSAHVDGLQLKPTPPTTPESPGGQAAPPRRPPREGPPAVVALSALSSRDEAAPSAGSGSDMEDATDDWCDAASELSRSQSISSIGMSGSLTCFIRASYWGSFLVIVSAFTFRDGAVKFASLTARELGLSSTSLLDPDSSASSPEKQAEAVSCTENRDTSCTEHIMQSCFHVAWLVRDIDGLQLVSLSLSCYI